jgi:hypothetical protein
VQAGAGQRWDSRSCSLALGLLKVKVMHCEASLDSGPLHSHWRDSSSAITFDEIEANDKVLIRTRNSEYRFSVIDPLNHKGMLSGGTLGEEPCEAFLIESRTKGEDGAQRNIRGLKTGARALFYLSSGHSIKRVTTSKISGLTLVKAADRTSLIS